MKIYKYVCMISDSFMFYVVTDLAHQYGTGACGLRPNIVISNHWLILQRILETYRKL